jgi:hypothetical protein
MAEEMEFRQLDTMVVSPEMEENQVYAEEENEISLTGAATQRGISFT